MKKNTDTAKVLKILQRSGMYGVHSFHLNQEVGTMRAAARILDLKKLGYDITSTPERLGDAVGVRYFLNSSPVSKPVVTQKKKISGYFDNVRGVFVMQ